MVFARRPHTPLPQKPITDDTLRHARALMAAFAGAVGSDPAIRRVSADIQAAAGVSSHNDLLKPGAVQAAWLWVSNVTMAAAQRGDLELAGQLFSFMSFWNANIVPLLGPPDWLDLCLDRTPRDLEARITAAALPCLVRLPHNHVIAGNATGQVTARDMVLLAASTITEFGESHPAFTPELLQLARGALAPTPPPTTGDPLLTLAAQQLGRVKNTLTELQLKYADLGEAIVGVGVGLSWGEFDWVVVTVLGGGLENAVSITAGVLKDIVHDRLELLDLCNRLTRDNPTYPVFLHDAQQGWDLLVQQQLPIDLMLTNPAFFKGCLENLPIYAQQKRQEIGNTTISGHRYTWNDDDTRRLLLRSMM